MPITMVRDQAHKLVDRMPEDASWDDLMHEIYVREVLEQGLTDSKAGRSKDVRDVRKKFVLPE